MKTSSWGAPCAGILSLALTAAAADAGPIIYDNGGTVAAYGSNLEQFVLADDFVLADGGVVADAGMYVGSTTEDLSGWDGTLTYWILADADGSPGSILSTGPGQNITTTETDMPWCCNGNAWLFEFDLETPFYAEPGITYWFGLHLASAFDENDPATLFWLGNGESGNMHQNYLGTFEQWDEESFEDVAFFLTTTAEISEPGSLVLLAATLLGLGLRRRGLGGSGRLGRGTDHNCTVGRRFRWDIEDSMLSSFLSMLFWFLPMRPRFSDCADPRCVRQYPGQSAGRLGGYHLHVCSRCHR